MKKPTGKWQIFTFRLGAITLLAGLVMKLFLLPTACIVTAVGTLLFTCMQMLMRYDGADIVILRLRRQQLMSDFIFLLMAAFMVMQDFGISPEWAKGNLWILCLFIAAALQIYTIFRLPDDYYKHQKAYK